MAFLYLWVSGNSVFDRFFKVLSIHILEIIVLPLLFAVSAAFSSNLFAQDNEKLIKDYISQNKLREYKKLDLNNFVVDNVDDSKSLNGTVVKFQQTYNGLPIYNAEWTAFIRYNKINKDWYMYKMLEYWN